MTDTTIPQSHRDLLDTPIAVALATVESDPDLQTLQKVIKAYGADLASFNGPLDDRRTVTLHPRHVVAHG